MSRTLPDAHDAFVAAIKRDIPGPDQKRHVAVLDALIAWSVARPDALSLREDGRSDVIGFQCAGSKTVFWSAQVTRGAGPEARDLPAHRPRPRR